MQVFLVVNTTRLNRVNQNVHLLWGDTGHSWRLESCGTTRMKRMHLLLHTQCWYHQVVPSPEVCANTLGNWSSYHHMTRRSRQLPYEPSKSWHVEAWIPFGDQWGNQLVSQYRSCTSYSACRSLCQRKQKWRRCEGTPWVLDNACHSCNRNKLKWNKCYILLQ